MNKILIIICLLFFIQNSSLGCDMSDLTLISHSVNGNSHTYNVQLCIGGGITGSSRGAGNSTNSFGLALHKHNSNITVTNYTTSLTSTETGMTNIASLQGALSNAPFECEEFIFFQQQTFIPFICVSSTAQCGQVHSDCFNITFTTNVAVDSIVALGIEGSGNPALGCLNESDMIIDFTTLPVELAYFHGNLEADKVELKWRTLSEVNNAVFEIERSRNGDEFEKIGTIEGSGNSLYPINYQYQDNLIESGKYYYRLKQTDFDGSFSYSSIITINYEQLQSDISIYPNPTTDILNISTTDFNELNVFIYNQTGQLIKSLSIDNQESNLISVQSLEQGFYIAKIIIDNQIYQQRFFKQ